jgi:hypothetical protein
MTFATVEDLGSCEMKITHIRQLARFGGTGCYTWSRNGTAVSSVSTAVRGRVLTITYRSTKQPESHPIKEMVLLETTFCNFGGERFWFCCPRCNRRTSSIFLTAPPFGCRVCLELRYESQRLGLADLTLARGLRIRKRLKGTGSAFGYGARPKGMHHRTYERLVREQVRLKRQFYTVL